MNTQLLIDAVVQQTVVFIAHLATAGGVRAPLVHVANQMFLELSRELGNQGVSKKVIADMFGMALRTYHRRVRELEASRTDSGRTLWEAVLGYLREREPVAAQELSQRFRNDDPEILSGVLNDLVGSGLVYRTGRGDAALYRAAPESDLGLGDEQRASAAYEYLTWLTVYRHGPLDLATVARLSRLDAVGCEKALERLASAGRVRIEQGTSGTRYVSGEFAVQLGTSRGWEAAVLDHFQAMVTAISSKILTGRARSSEQDVVGVRREVEDLRVRVDAHNAGAAPGPRAKRVVYYMGQYVRDDESRDVAAGMPED
jgi:hypothetical protein